MANEVDTRAGELTTANYGWVKPTVGASVDAWGGYLNADLDGIDSTVHSIQTSVPAASSTTPAMNGVAAVGVGATFARADHVHPVDTSCYQASNPSGYQTAAQVTAAVPVGSSSTPHMDGTAAVGTGTTWARADHVHPTDTSLLPLAGGNLTGAVSSTAGITANGLVSNAQLSVATTMTVGGVSTFNSNLNMGAGTVGHFGTGVAATGGVLVADNVLGSVGAQFMCSQAAAGVTSVIVRNDRTDGYAIRFYFGASTICGTISQNGSTTTYGTTSDYRLKTVHGDASAQVGAMIDSVEVYDAEWKNADELASKGDVEHCRRYPMFLAHELQAACPWAVLGEKDAVNDEGEIIPQQVDASHVVAVLWAEIRNLRARVAELEVAKPPSPSKEKR